MKISGFFGNQIVREIIFGHFEAPKTAISTIDQLLIFNFWEFLTFSIVKFFQRSKFTAFQIVTMTVLDPLTLAKIDFM